MEASAGEWQLEALLAERVEKARRLAEEELRDDSGLKWYLEGMDATIALHRAFLDGDARRREGLSPAEELQGMVALLRYMLTVGAQPVIASLLHPRCTEALSDAVMKRVAAQAGSEEQPGPDDALLTLVPAALLAIRLRGDTEDALQTAIVEVVHLFSDKSAKDGSWTDMRAPLRRLAAWLEEQQQQTGLPLGLSLHELQRAACIIFQMVSLKLLRLRAECGSGQAQQPWQQGQGQGDAPSLPHHVLVEGALSASQRLLKLEPEERISGVALRMAELFLANQQPDEAAKAYRLAMEKAVKVKDRCSEAAAALYLALVLTACRFEPRWSLTEVRGLLASAEAALGHCRRWLPNATLSPMRHTLAPLRRSVEATAARHPGQDLLPPPEGDDEDGSEEGVLHRRCGGCCRPSTHLQACSRCRSVHYCSRECQVTHWKQGGHKQACAALAAARQRG